MPRTKRRPKKNDAPTAHEPALGKDVKADDIPPRRLSDLLSEALKVFEQKLIDDEAFRSTLAEYLKMLQVERDLQLETNSSTEIAAKCVALTRHRNARGAAVGPRHPGKDELDERETAVNRG
jgi:hypothetical protein